MNMIERCAEYTVYESPRSQTPPLHARMPGISKTASEDLIAMYQLSEVIDRTIAHVYVSRSSDMGNTWHFDGELYDYKKAKTGFEYDEAVKPLLLSNGSLIALGYRFNRPDLDVPLVNPQTGGFLWGPNVVSHSRDDGKAWTVTEVVDCGVPETIELAGSPIQTRSGDILAIGAAFKQWDGSNPTGQVGILVRSTDNACSWNASVHYYADSKNGIIPYEARICEMQDGRLVAIVWAFCYRDGRNYPNHVVVSHDNGYTWSNPMDTGHMAQSTGIMWVKDELLLTIHCHRTGENTGLYLRLVDFTSDVWSVVEEQCIWNPAHAQSNIGDIVYQVGTLEFGQPQLMRLNNKEVLAYHWGKEDGLAKIKAHRLRLHV